MLTHSDLQKFVRHGMMAGILLAAACFANTLCFAQPPQRVEQRGLQQLIRETQESLASEKWLEAAERLDQAWSLASRSDDPLMETSGTEVRQLAPGETENLAGGKAVLEALFRNAPGGFHTEFTRQFSEIAEQQISAALKSGDLEEVRRRTERYALTATARRGLLALVKSSADRGDYLEAALLMGRLQRMSDSPDNATSLQMAYCFNQSGLESDAADHLDRLMREQGLSSVRLGTEDVMLPKSAEEMRPWMQRNFGQSVTQSTNWLQPGGDYRRAATQFRGPAKLQSAWRSNLFEVQDVLYAEQYNPLLAEFREPIEREASRLLQRNSTIVPTAIPLITGDMAILRTPFGIRAVNLKTGELQWEVTRPDSRLKMTVDERTRESSARGIADSRQFDPRAVIDPRGQLLYQMVRTNTASQMSIIGDTLFVVDESSATTWNDELQYQIRGEAASTPSNMIRAYNVRTGLFKWEAGGQTQSAAMPAGRGNLLSGFYFLGAPLVLGQRTYVLAESGEGIFLIQLVEPGRPLSPVAGADGEQLSENPGIVRSQILTVPQTKLPLHPLRKHAGLVPSFAQGLLICPTCDERVVAVSADDHSIRWVFRYASNLRIQELGGDGLVLFGSRNPLDTRTVDMDARWVDSLPRIVGSRVLVTPRDSDQMYCLDLQTGKQQWIRPRGAFHSIGAVTADRLVLVGNQRVAAVSLSDGNELWSTEIRDGVVCGTAAFSGSILQIPTSEPGIVAIDIENGRRLVLQSGDFGRMPGNLLITRDGLLAQNLSSVTFVPSIAGASSETASPAAVEQATELLLNQKTDEAQLVLDREVSEAPQNGAAREMLIELLLEGLRFDFARNQGNVSRVRELIELAARDIPIAPLLHSLLGMNLPDAAVVPRQLRGRTDRYLGDLSELVAEGMESSDQTSVDVLTDNIRQLIRELPGESRKVVQSGFLVRTKSTIACGGIRSAIAMRTQEERSAIQLSLQPTAVEIIAALPDRNSRVVFLHGLISCGLPELALAAINNNASAEINTEAETTLPTNAADEIWLLQEFARLAVSQSTSAHAGEETTGLLESWKALGDQTAIAAWIADVAQAPEVRTTLRFQQPDTALRDEQLAAWKAAHPETAGPSKSVWGANPAREESPDRTMMGLAKSPDQLPDRLLPVYGAPGVYRGWSFARTMPTGDLCAFDPDGVVRWTMPFFGATDDIQYHGYAADSYITVYGHLLIVNLSGAIYAINPALLTPEGKPQELWRKMTQRMAPDSDSEEYRDYVAPADRLPQYLPQPAGFYPVGLLTPTGLPIISGRRLLMLHPLTGDPLWQVDGVARDAVLLSTSENLLVISEGAAQIEVRRLVNGEVVSVHRLPEWWGDANNNVGSSVEDIDVEDGVNLLWRVILDGQSCVLFRLTGGKSVLEQRDLLTDAVNWSIEMPEQTVFSNVIDDVVAVLSEGKQLRLVHVDTGRVLIDTPVNAVTKPRELVLRHSHGHYLVLPESVEDPTLEHDPVTDAHHVFGRIYAVNSETLKLAWDEPLDHRHIRLATSERAVLLPNAPVLVLLSRGGDSAPGTPRVSNYGALILDVRTGKELYRDDDVGKTLNKLWMHIDAAKRQLQISFDRRVVTFTYPAAR